VPIIKSHDNPIVSLRFQPIGELVDGFLRSVLEFDFQCIGRYMGIANGHVKRHRIRLGIAGALGPFVMRILQVAAAGGVTPTAQLALV
jgi:hypothetical protein